MQYVSPYQKIFKKTKRNYQSAKKVQKATKN